MRSLMLGAALCLPTMSLLAESAAERLKEATEVFSEIMSTPDKAIPQDLLEKAHCVVIVPGVKKAAFIVGAKYGRGFATCRRPSGRGWGPPGAVRVEGGSFGFQIGASSTDVVMLVMNERGMEKLLSDKFTLGADASVAAGPVGRTVSAETDAKLSAEILSWSRSKGLFAGMALNGATLRNDLDTNHELYGAKLNNGEVVMSAKTPPPDAAQLITELNKYSITKEGSTSADRRVETEHTTKPHTRKPR